MILVEGQDDIAAYPDIATQIGGKFSGNFFGWGVGGADNMAAVAAMLKDLGFSRVIAIFDGNKRDAAKKFAAEFSNFGCFILGADDVRSKPSRPEMKEVRGVLDEKGKVQAEHVEEMKNLIAKTNECLKDGSTSD